VSHFINTCVECYYAECHNAERRYAECRGAIFNPVFSLGVVAVLRLPQRPPPVLLPPRASRQHPVGHGQAQDSPGH